MSTLLVLILFPVHHFCLKHLEKKNLNFVNYFLLGVLVYFLQIKWDVSEKVFFFPLLLLSFDEEFTEIIWIDTCY